MVNNSSSSGHRNINLNLFSDEALMLHFKNDGIKAGLDGFDPSKMVPAREKKEKKSKAKGEGEGDAPEQGENTGSGQPSTGNTTGGSPKSAPPGETDSDFPFSYGGPS